MAAIVQVGTTLKIGFGSFAYAGYVAQSVSEETTGEIKVIKDANNATMTKLIEDKGFRLTLKLLILDSGGSITPPAKGTTVTLIPPKGTSTSYMCEASSVDFTAEESTLNLTLVDEDSMTYS